MRFFAETSENKLSSMFSTILSSILREVNSEMGKRENERTREDPSRLEGKRDLRL